MSGYTLKDMDGIEIKKVSNGYILQPSQQANAVTNGSFLTVKEVTAVARSPEELVKVIYQWATGEELVGIPLEKSG